MTMPYFIYSEQKIYASAVKMLLDELDKSNRAFDDFSQLKDELSNSSGTIIIICPSSKRDPYELCQQISRLHPLTAVLLLIEENKLDYKKGMYVGAVDILDIDSDEEEIIDSLKKAEEVIALKIKGNEIVTGEGKEAKIMTVCSTKGGVGKTTISVNTATALSKSNLKVAVIDLDLQFGDIALLFDLQPPRTIYDWVKQSFENGDKSFQRFFIEHPTGIDVLAAPILPEFAELITGEHIGYLLDAIRSHYDVVIVDTPPTFVETSLVALEKSDVILLIASLDLPALKNGKLAIETLNLLGLSDKIRVVINRDDDTEGMTMDLVENVLGRKIETSIPSDYRTVIASINRGEPFITLEPRSQVAKAVMKLSEQIIHVKEEELSPRKKEKKKKRFILF